jgi:hypothetical protein
MRDHGIKNVGAVLAIALSFGWFSSSVIASMRTHKPILGDSPMTVPPRSQTWSRAWAVGGSAKTENTSAGDSQIASHFPSRSSTGVIISQCLQTLHGESGRADG